MTFVDVTLVVILAIVLLTVVLDGMNMLVPASMSPLLRTHSTAEAKVFSPRWPPHQLERTRKRLS